MQHSNIFRAMDGSELPVIFIIFTLCLSSMLPSCFELEKVMVVGRMVRWCVDYTTCFSRKMRNFGEARKSNCVYQKTSAKDFFSSETNAVLA